ncbi:MAG: hypothetical protein Q3986_06530 [Akkermansia sp.]|nr:hypothetical protein [Akkermansia sp.]
MRVDLTKNEVYVVTTTAPVTLTCESGGTTFELAHVEPGQQGTFKALENYCDYECAGKVDIRNFNGAPAGLLGGGGSSMTLRTGVLAPVTAQVALVPGDLSQGGTLSDGEVTVELPALEDVKASGSAEVEATSYVRMLGTVNAADGSMLVDVDLPAFIDLDGLVSGLNSREGMSDVMVFSHDGQRLHATAVEAGTAGNGIVLAIHEIKNPFREIEMTLSGGADGAHTLGELMEAINAESAGLGCSAAVVGETVVLTALEAGSTGNGKEYTVTGCFGSGTVEQGSLVAGRDAVTGRFTVGDGQSARYLVQGYEGMSVEWPEDWLWLEGRAPYLDDGKNYIIEAVNDGNQTISKKLIEYDRTSN